MQFANPKYFWLFLTFIPLIAWYVWRQRTANPTLGTSTLRPFNQMGTPLRAYLRHLLFVLRLAALGILIVILARPQQKDNWRTSSTEGTDIVVALDVSSSMLARDLKPNRIDAAKDIASKFISARTDDNIGIVVFAGESLTGLPMTIDHTAIVNYIQGVNTQMLSDGTAIGEGLATSLNRILQGRAKSKSIILLTDGSNNTGLISPLHAAEIAKNNKVKIYTIAIGTNGTAEAPDHIDQFGRIVYSRQQVVIDEGTLRTIADQTGGKYFRATNNKTLGEIFAEIDRLEKTKMDVRHFSHTEDNFMPWAWLLLAIVLCELGLRYTLFRSIP